MGFCVLVVCGLNKLASVAAGNQVEHVYSSNGNERNASLDAPTTDATSMLHKILLSAVFVLIGLFCWKVVVRNCVWNSRETLFR